MNIVEAAQGSSAWHAHRATHFNASDAPAMMGISPYKTRSQLLREMATGITPEIDPATQRRFDDGHRFEALARPLAEEILGEELFPVVGYEGKLSASFDGLTMDGLICFEHKTINQAYRDAIATGEKLPIALLVQIEQQLWASKAERCLFMASKWTEDDELVEEVHCMVESDPELMASVIKGWEQFQHDLENYQHEEVIAAPVAATIEALPALFVQVEGKVLATNLDAFKLSAQKFIDGIKTELVNDQDFADADKMVKFLKDGEERLALAKSQALSQTASIDELFRTLDAISEQMRVKRLALDKLVKSEKENRKNAIVTDAMHALTDHVAKLNQRIGGNWIPPMNGLHFVDAVKGLKSIDSMRDKVAGALANGKIAANELADRIDANRKSLLIGTENDTLHLFPDFAQVCTKAREDFAALHAMRIQQEAVRKETERQAEAARIAAAVEAERKAGEARAAAAVEAERMAEAKWAAEQEAADQRAKTSEATHGEPNATAIPQAPLASSPPTPEEKRAVLVEAGDAVRDFLNLHNVPDKERGSKRAFLMAWEQFKTERALRVAA
jgi:putative phage-type endonuclease